MSNRQVVVRNGGIGFGGTLTIVLLILKVTGYINIGWLWVFAPIWIPFLIAMGIIGLIFVAAMVAALTKD